MYINRFVLSSFYEFLFPTLDIDALYRITDIKEKHLQADADAFVGILGFRLSMLYQHLDSLVAYLDDCHRARQTGCVQRCRACSCNDRIEFYAIHTVEYYLCACFCTLYGNGVPLCLYQDRNCLHFCYGISSVDMATIVPKLLQGAFALYCQKDTAGTWSVAFWMYESAKASSLPVKGTLSA